MAKQIKIYTRSTTPALDYETGGPLHGFDPGAPHADSDRESALYSALGASTDDNEIVLGTLPDGRWALVGPDVTGHKFAIEAQQARRRTITLTDRNPVTIDENAWRTVAKASGDSYTGHDYGRHQQALSQGEVDEYQLRVRQHADGRAIVYAVLDGARAWTGTESRRGGKLCAAGADLVAAIRRVGEDVGLPDRIIRDCVADLPAEEI